jgi:hypothetical protein
MQVHCFLAVVLCVVVHVHVVQQPAAPVQRLIRMVLLPSWLLHALKHLIPLHALLLQIPGVPIMYLSQHRYSIERLPEATIGGAPRT